MKDEFRWIQIIPEPMTAKKINYFFLIGPKQRFRDKIDLAHDLKI